MSYEAKAALVTSLKQRLYPVLTAADMDKVIEIVREQLDGYDLMQHAPESDGPDDLLDTYIAALSIEGRSAKTLERYRYILGRMFDSVKLPTRKVTVYHLRTYLASEKQRGIADTTLNGYREIFCAYFNWLQKEGLIAQNPTINLSAIKCRKVVRPAYTDVDLEKLRSNCTSLRDRAIIAFLLATGCRISEVTQLNRDDLDLVGMECKVLGKGNKERKVYFDAVTAMLVDEYLQSRTDGFQALFCGKGTERLTPGGIRDMLRKVGARADVDKVHPHRFRRTFATVRSSRGMSIEDIAWLLGHDKLDTTLGYIERNEEDIKHNYRKYSK